MANLNFDANQVEPSAFEPIPAGKYLAVITESEMKDTKAGTGRYLQLTFEIIEGQCKGRKQWARLNLENPNAQAVQIAQGQLSAICRAVGVMVPKDSTDLHDLPLVITVKLEKREDTGDLSNVVSRYSKRETAAVPAVTVAAAGSAAPWKR